MRIAICDDERHFLDDFTVIMDRLYKSLDIIIDKFTDGASLLKAYDNVPYDIVFLDIEMPGMDGIYLANILRGKSEDVFIVFLTSHIEYALKGYEVNALRYLTKPATELAVREAIDYVLKKQNNMKSLWLKTSDGDQKILINHIIFLEAQDQKVIINTINGKIEIRSKLNDFESRLKNDGFFRIHRSYLVSLSKVMAFVGRDITMSDGTVLPVGRTKENEFKAALMSYVGREAF